MITHKELNEKSKELENKYQLNHYELLQRFMFGIENRTTKDMDTSIKGIDISKENILNILNEILTINLNDGIKFNILDVTEIREDDQYGGNKYHIIGRLENLKVNLDIDISTGDSITPRELKYKYPLTFENRSILISSYNLETIISEKLETILRRGQYNTRMKDYYDIYIFLTKLKNEIKIEILKQAIKNTFENRNSLDNLNDFNDILDSISEYKRIKNYWINYQNKNKYASNINFQKILETIREFIKKLNIALTVN